MVVYVTLFPKDSHLVRNGSPLITEWNGGEVLPDLLR